ncbi:MAG: DUF859 family phage minor structural protein [Bacilli bacterium]
MTLTTNYQRVAQGSSKTFGSATGRVDIYAKYTQQDVANNRHYVVVRLDLIVSGGYIGSYSGNSKNLSATGLNGFNTSMSNGNYTSQTLGTIEGWVYHNSDGKKSMSFSGGANFGAWGISISASGSADLPTIPRASTISLANSNINVGENLTINISKKYSGYTDKLLIMFGSGFSKTIENVNSQYVWITEDDKQSLYEQMPNVNSLEGIATVQTYNGTTLIGTNSARFTLNVTQSNPIFDNFTYEDSNPSTIALTGNNQIIIKGYSKLKGIVSTSNKAVAQNSATMTKYRLVVGEKQVEFNYSDTEEVSGTIEKVDNNIFNMYAIDSRNNSTLKTISPSSYKAYKDINVTNLKADRDVGVLGEKVKISFSGEIWNDNFGDVQNTISISYRFRKSDVDEWTIGTTPINPTITDNTFSFEGYVAGDLENTGFNISESYYIEVIVNDKLSSDKDSTSFGSGKPNMAIHKMGVSFNQPFDENSGYNFQSAGSAVFENLTVTGDVSGITCSDVYSTEEIKTNKVWIDGSPIYRKVVTFTVADTGGVNNVNISALSINHLISITGEMRKSVNEIYKLPYANKSESLVIIFHQGYLKYRCNVPYMNGCYCYVTVEYTKTN